MSPGAAGGIPSSLAENQSLSAMVAFRLILPGQSLPVRFKGFSLGEGSCFSSVPNGVLKNSDDCEKDLG